MILHEKTAFGPIKLMIHMGNAGLELSERIKTYERETVQKLDDTLSATMDELDVYFGRLEDLVRIAFDEKVNTELRLAASIRIAECVDVPSGQILRSTADLNAFMEE